MSLFHVNIQTIEFCKGVLKCDEDKNLLNDGVLVCTQELLATLLSDQGSDVVYHSSMASELSGSFNAFNACFQGHTVY